MKRLWTIMLGSLLILLSEVDHSRGAEDAPPIWGYTPPPNQPGHASEAAANNHQAAYRLDFSAYRGGPLETWLASKGFKFEEAAKNPDALKLSVQDGGLIFEAKEQLRGFVFKDSMESNNFTKVRLEWGILQYPEGASYEKHIRNEALMVYISFGHEKMPSGSLFLPDVPYFIGVFLCKDDKLNTPYIGRYYQEGGRFVCLAHTEPQQTIISEFDLAAAFRTYFEKDEVPPVSGLNLGVDTSDAGDGGKAAAYLKSIELIP